MITIFELSVAPEVRFSGKFEYLCYNLEKCPESGRYHYQCYIYFKTRTRFSQCKIYEPTAHWEPRQKTHTNAKKYCTKEETRVEGPFEFGSDALISETQGERSDLDVIKCKIEQGVKPDEIAEEHFNSYCRYYKAFDRYYRYQKGREIEEEMSQMFSNNFVLRGWQMCCLEDILDQNNRKVKWIVDIKGNTGKSTFCDYLQAKHDAFIITGGSHKDIAYDYQMQKIVVFDLPRAYVDHKDIYKLIEDFKNGRVFSTKYESCSKRVVGVKVAVFTNWQPDFEMLSEDRWDVTRLDDINAYKERIEQNEKEIFECAEDEVHGMIDINQLMDE